MNQNAPSVSSLPSAKPAALPKKVSLVVPPAPASAPVLAAAPSEDDIRAYAYHLYIQSNRDAGHDLDHWFEAAACLQARIPADSSHGRLHRHIGAPIVHAAPTHAGAN